MRRGTPAWALLAVITLAALVGWSAPDAAGDLRPSPDAVEYGLGAVSLASLQAPETRIGDVAAPPRYPFGYPLLAAPFVRAMARGGALQPQGAVLASAAAGVVLAVGLVLAGWRSFGLATGVAGALLTLCSPFYATYSRLVMAEMPSAALFALLAAGLAVLAGGAPRRAAESGGAEGPRVWWWGFALGLLAAVSVWVRLSNVQTLPAVVAGLLLATPGRRREGLAGLLLGLALGALPLLVYHRLTYGGPLTTGYSLWTPEWAGGAGARPAFGAGYALGRPGLPAGAGQGNLAHYGAAWLGLPAAGDGGVPVGSPLHATMAGLLAVGAVLGFWRAFAPLTSPVPGLGPPTSGLRSAVRARLPLPAPARPARSRRAARAVGGFVGAGLLGAFAFYAPYYYQDVRFLAPWAPLWLLMAGAGLLGLMPPFPWPPQGVRWLAPLAALAVLGAGLGAGPGVIGAAPLWRWRVLGEAPAPAPRLEQARALARDLPDDAWIVSAIDGPLLDLHVLRGTRRRYLPLARGLEFVDKPPFRALVAAPDETPAIVARAASGGLVVVDRWTLEFAEGLSDYRRELERLLANLDVVPLAEGGPLHPDAYALVPRMPDRSLGRYALREGEPLRDSTGGVFVVAEGVRRHVPDLRVFTARGLRWEEVRRLPDVVLAAIPEGPPLGP